MIEIGFAMMSDKTRAKRTGGPGEEGQEESVMREMELD